MIQFKIGMAYATLAKNTSAIICNRSKSFVTVKTVRPGSPDKIFRKKIFVFTSSITDDYEYIKNDGLRDAWCNAVEFADEQPTTAEITTASDNDNATASQHANVATAESETTAKISRKRRSSNRRKSLNYSHFTPNTAPITPSAVKRLANLLKVLQPETMYMDDSFSDAPGDNSCPEQDIPECREAESIPADDNPGFTVVPSSEITRPDYASYPDAIHDDIPCVNVPACDFHAAVVPYEHAANIRNLFRLIALYLRLWLTLHLPARDSVIAPIVHADFRDITPQQQTKNKTRKHKNASEPDIEYKLIDTKDLHFTERRKALDHNAAVITSCMFPEAVISLLMSISPQAIIQLGVYMGLFIAKPKGKKIAIAELFANKLMASREFHAHIRTKSENTSSKSHANIPDGVKFVQLKNRQLGFIFTE